MNTLLVRLVGPMQSWGTRSRFVDRDTNMEPTSSGVLGLLCAALGRDRSSSVADLASLRMGVRVDAPGHVSTDFHTAMEVARAGGGRQHTVVSQRHYLADARFWVGLEGSDSMQLEGIRDALRNPVWLLSLGRRSFPLSVPPCHDPGCLAFGRPLEEALSAAPWLRLRPREHRPESVTMVVESSDGSMSISDRIYSFVRREFGLRQVRVLEAKPLAVEDLFA